jgi:hypothetical protein
MVAEREQDKGANGFTVYSLARGLLSRCKDEIPQIDNGLGD